MANLANITNYAASTLNVGQTAPEGLVSNFANRIPLPVLLFEGNATIYDMQAAALRGPLAQPLQTSGDSTPLGPQRWPL